MKRKILCLMLSLVMTLIPMAGICADATGTVEEMNQPHMVDLSDLFTGTLFANEGSEVDSSKIVGFENKYAIKKSALESNYIADGVLDALSKDKLNVGCDSGKPSGTYPVLPTHDEVSAYTGGSLPFDVSAALDDEKNDAIIVTSNTTETVTLPNSLFSGSEGKYLAFLYGVRNTKVYLNVTVYFTDGTTYTQKVYHPHSNYYTNKYGINSNALIASTEETPTWIEKVTINGDGKEVRENATLTATVIPLDGKVIDFVEIRSKDNAAPVLAVTEIPLTTTYMQSYLEELDAEIAATTGIYSDELYAKYDTAVKYLSKLVELGLANENSYPNLKKVEAQKEANEAVNIDLTNLYNADTIAEVDDTTTINKWYSGLKASQVGIKSSKLGTSDAVAFSGMEYTPATTDAEGNAVAESFKSKAENNYSFTIPASVRAGGVNDAVLISGKENTNGITSSVTFDLEKVLTKDIRFAVDWLWKNHTTFTAKVTYTDGTTDAGETAINPDYSQYAHSGFKKYYNPADALHGFAVKNFDFDKNGVILAKTELAEGETGNEAVSVKADDVFSNGGNRRTIHGFRLKVNPSKIPAKLTLTIAGTEAGVAVYAIDQIPVTLTEMLAYVDAVKAEIPAAGAYSDELLAKAATTKAYYNKLVELNVISEADYAAIPAFLETVEKVEKMNKPNMVDLSDLFTGTLYAEAGSEVDSSKIVGFKAKAKAEKTDPVTTVAFPKSVLSSQYISNGILDAGSVHGLNNSATGVKHPLPQSDEVKAYTGGSLPFDISAAFDEAGKDALIVSKDAAYTLDSSYFSGSESKYLLVLNAIAGSRGDMNLKVNFTDGTSYSQNIYHAHANNGAANYGLSGAPLVPEEGNWKTGSGTVRLTASAVPLEGKIIESVTYNAKTAFPLVAMTEIPLTTTYMQSYLSEYDAEIAAVTGIYSDEILAKYDTAVKYLSKLVELGLANENSYPNLKKVEAQKEINSPYYVDLSNMVDTNVIVDITKEPTATTITSRVYNAASSNLGDDGIITMTTHTTPGGPAKEYKEFDGVLKVTFVALADGVTSGSAEDTRKWYTVYRETEGKTAKLSGGFKDNGNDAVSVLQTDADGVTIDIPKTAGIAESIGVVMEVRNSGTYGAERNPVITVNYTDGTSDNTKVGIPTKNGNFTNYIYTKSASFGVAYNYEDGAYVKDGGNSAYMHIMDVPFDTAKEVESLTFNALSGHDYRVLAVSKYHVALAEMLAYVDAVKAEIPAAGAYSDELLAKADTVEKYYNKLVELNAISEADYTAIPAFLETAETQKKTNADIYVDLTPYLNDDIMVNLTDAVGKNRTRTQCFFNSNGIPADGIITTSERNITKDTLNDDGTITAKAMNEKWETVVDMATKDNKYKLSGAYKGAGNDSVYVAKGSEAVTIDIPETAGVINEISAVIDSANAEDNKYHTTKITVNYTDGTSEDKTAKYIRGEGFYNSSIGWYAGCGTQLMVLDGAFSTVNEEGKGLNTNKMFGFSIDFDKSKVVDSITFKAADYHDYNIIAITAEVATIAEMKAFLDELKTASDNYEYYGAVSEDDTLKAKTAMMYKEALVNASIIAESEYPLVDNYSAQIASQEDLYVDLTDYLNVDLMVDANDTDKSDWAREADIFNGASVPADGVITMQDAYTSHVKDSKVVDGVTYVTFSDDAPAPGQDDDARKFYPVDNSEAGKEFRLSGAYTGEGLDAVQVKSEANEGKEVEIKIPDNGYAKKGLSVILDTKELSQYSMLKANVTVKYTDGTYEDLTAGYNGPNLYLGTNLFAHSAPMGTALNQSNGNGMHFVSAAIDYDTEKTISSIVFKPTVRDYNIVAISLYAVDTQTVLDSTAPITSGEVDYANPTVSTVDAIIAGCESLIELNKRGFVNLVPDEDVAGYEVALANAKEFNKTVGKLTATATVEGASATVSVRNLTGDLKAYVVAMAAYKDNKLVSLNIGEEGTIAQGTLESGQTVENIAISTDAVEGATYKVLVWESLATMKPIVIVD